MTTFVITGAGRGMGRDCVEVVRDLASEIVAVDLTAPDIEGAVGVACDVSKPDDIAALVERVRQLGPLGGLVHAAAISPTMAEARRVFEVDLVGTQLVLDAFEALVVEGSAAVCFSSSAAYQMAPYADPALDVLLDDPLASGFLDQITSHVPDSGLAYSLAKRGVIRAAARAAVTWGARGGRVNSVAPGVINTPMGRQEFERQPIMQVMLDHTPLKRLGEPSEVAATVAFLLSEQASFVSGIDILVDGGMIQGMSKVDLAG